MIQGITELEQTANELNKYFNDYLEQGNKFYQNVLIDRKATQDLVTHADNLVKQILCLPLR
jgi:3'-phosphoadenosine 5'-phosphosulfate (PAPS) 3'-phosphatase